jgi:hypothetical protein
MLIMSFCILEQDIIQRYNKKLVISEEKTFISVCIGMSSGGRFSAEDIFWEGCFGRRMLCGKDVLWGGCFVFRTFF